MSYLLTHYEEGGETHWCRLSRVRGAHIAHVLSARFTTPELLAFIEMLKKLDQTEVVEQAGAYR
jgi:hypothetical protein